MAGGRSFERTGYRISLVNRRFVRPAETANLEMTRPSPFRRLPGRWLAFVTGCILCFGVAGEAQVSPSQGAPPVRRHGRPADEKTAADEPANTPAPSDPASIAAATKGASRPASVTLASGKLTIAADNSDLGAILQQIAHDSGMKIDGLGDNSRVFGV